MHRHRHWITLLFVGLAGGVLSGAFGVGGGIVMVPLLVSLARMDQRQAAMVSLVAIVPAAVAGSIAYLVTGSVDIPVAVVVAVGAILGALVGTQLLRRIRLPWLRWMFVALLLVVAARMLLVVPERGEQVELGLLVGIGLFALGLVMGLASGLFGVGGGVIAVPVLIAVFGAGDLVAKGTSLLIMIPTALAGTLSNLRAGLVNVRAGVLVGLAATAASPLGVALAVLMTPQVSSIIFAALMILAATQLAIKAIRDGRSRPSA